MRQLYDKFNDIVNEWIDNIQYPETPWRLYKPIEYSLSTGGKRLRPVLLLAALNAFDGKLENARNQCVAIEMFHNFTLIHDDVMDNSEVRRGQPAVHCRWDENTAILSGDTMLTLANQYMSSCDDRHLRAINDLFNRTAIEVYEGQQLDMDFEDRNDVSVDEYLNMIRLKTSVLLGCSLKIGAILGEATPEQAQALYDYGIFLGLGFQLRDDYLDTFGDPLIFGKPIGNDILNNKKTWLMINALKEDKSGVMENAVANRLEGQEKIDRVTLVYKQLDLHERILDLIHNYSSMAIDNVKNLDINPETKEFLIQLAKHLVERMN